jgi:Ni,Fe-hydrogenase III large subunit
MNWVEMANANDAAASALTAVRDGARFVALFADESDDKTILRFVVDVDGSLSVRSGVVDRGLASISDCVPAALWHEREVRDRFRVVVDGLPDGRPILPPVSAEAFRRVRSREASTILYGPVRSGIVESARWVIETAGEDFLSVYPSMFFKHRGLEDRFRGTDLELAPFVAEHVSGATAASHAIAFCKAVEAALAIEVPLRAKAARSILIEFERIHQHLDSLAKLADDGSLSVGSAQTFASKERVHRLLAEATGNRFSRGVVCVGGLREDVFGSLQKGCASLLDEVERETLSVVEALFGTQSLLDRLVGTGRLSETTVRRYGGVGPVARASGIACDARAAEDWEFTPLLGEQALEEDGDAMARSRVRRTEIRESFRLIRNALDAEPGGSHRSELPEVGAASAIGRVESPQGELVYFVRLDGGLRRVAIRSASYANWPLFVPALPGNIFTDFSFIEHSFGLIQAETDR